MAATTARTRTSRPARHLIRTAGALAVAGAGVLLAVPPALATHDAPGLPAVAPMPARPKACLAMPGWARGTPATVSHPAPGMTLESWTGDGAEGIRMKVTAIEADAVRARLQVWTPDSFGQVLDTTSVPDRKDVVAALNGDYFDPGPAGAVPRGVEVSGGTVLYAPTGNLRTIGTDTDGDVSSGIAHLVGSFAVTDAGGGPKLAIGSVNSARTSPRGLSLLTAYGSGTPRSGAWYVLERHGVVVRSSASDPGAPHGPDLLLVAPSALRKRLSRVKVGAHVDVHTAVRTSDGVTFIEAMGRGGLILDDQAIIAKCTGSYGTGWRPRSVIAWNPEQEKLWIVVVNALVPGANGPGVRGFTYAQMADVARHLGATDAVLVDGGHSTTLAVRSGHGATRVDAPAWAGQRPVADGLVLTEG